MASTAFLDREVTLGMEASPKAGAGESWSSLGSLITSRSHHARPDDYLCSSFT